MKSAADHINPISKAERIAVDKVPSSVATFEEWRLLSKYIRAPGGFDTHRAATMTRSRSKGVSAAKETVIIREQLADEEIDVLRALVTRVPVIAHTSSLRVQGSTLLAPRFSIPVGQGYVEISALAKESPRSGFTYHRLQVRLVEHPTGLAKVKLATGKTIVGAPQSSVVLVSAGAPITRIEVFQHRESDRDEVVVFDCALIFEREDEGTFGVETPGVMLDAVELSLDPTVINAMRGKRRRRLVISG